MQSDNWYNFFMHKGKGSDDKAGFYNKIVHYT
jgi:hypothetical protein